MKMWLWDGEPGQKGLMRPPRFGLRFISIVQAPQMPPCLSVRLRPRDGGTPMVVVSSSSSCRKELAGQGTIRHTYAIARARYTVSPVGTFGKSQPGLTPVHMPCLLGGA